VGEPFPTDGYIEDTPAFEGEQLAFIFAVSCHPCWNAVANVEALVAEGTYEVIGVTASTREEIGWFQRHFEPHFPIFSYDAVRFGEAFRFWPALYYLEDGVIVGKVEGDIPTLKTLEDVHFTEW
jgi:hypothetical protein